jgi:hypothetical protein
MVMAFADDLIQKENEPSQKRAKTEEENVEQM